MKKLFLVVALFFVLTIGEAQVVKQHGKLNVKGTQLVNARGEVIALHGMSFGWHNWCT